MSSLKPMSKIRKDLAFFDKYWVVIYGSYVTGEFIPGRSDIDIAIITQNREKQTNLDIWSQTLGRVPPYYDGRIFELLPLFLQIGIIENHKVVFGVPLEISEYFYHYRRLWKDMITRVECNQFHNIKEKLDSMAYYSRLFPTKKL